MPTTFVLNSLLSTSLSTDMQPGSVGFDRGVDLQRWACCLEGALFINQTRSSLMPFRFQTCSDQAGVEKLAITAPVGGMVKQRPPFTCQDLFPHFPNCKEVVGPMGCLFVKGWTRSVAATCVMVACWEVSELLEAWCHLLCSGTLTFQRQLQDPCCRPYLKRPRGENMMAPCFLSATC